MTRKQLTNIGKKALGYGLAILAILSIIVMAGEPEDTATAAEILIPKAVALATFAGVVFFGRHAQRNGWLPDGEKPFNE